MFNRYPVGYLLIAGYQVGIRHVTKARYLEEFISGPSLLKNLLQGNFFQRTSVTWRLSSRTGARARRETSL